MKGIDNPLALLIPHARLASDMAQPGFAVNECYLPLYVATGTDIKDLNLWWRKIGTPTSVIYREIGLLYGAGFEVTANGASQGVECVWDITVEPRMVLGEVVSVGVGLHVPVGRTLSIRVSNSDGSGSTVTHAGTGSWVIVHLESVALAGTVSRLQFWLDGDGVFYVCPRLNVGPRVIPTAPRGTRCVDGSGTAFVNGTDPGGATIDVDLTFVTSPLACMIEGFAQYLNTSAGGVAMNVRRKGDTSANLPVFIGVSTSAYTTARFLVSLDDGQLIQFWTSAAAGDTETVYMRLIRYWEWA